MKIVITGTSHGIGKKIAEKFLKNGHTVVGLDIDTASIKHENYTHIVCDVAKKETLPEITGVDILINNAGVQNSGRDIDVNLRGTIFVTEKYAVRNGIKSILMTASASARTGAEFPEYTASKGGVVAYMKNVALRVAEFGAVCNSISAGGVITKSNDHIIKNKKLWARVMAETPMKKWATEDEIADFAYFLTVENKSMTAQDILVDNGETARSCFIW